MKGQTDIFGETQSLKELESPRYIQRDASVPQGTQSRLFEPQMEGQLTLEMRTPASRTGAAGATTNTEGNADA